MNLPGGRDGDVGIRHGEGIGAILRRDHSIVIVHGVEHIARVGREGQCRRLAATATVHAESGILHRGAETDAAESHRPAAGEFDVRIAFGLAAAECRPGRQCKRARMLVDARLAVATETDALADGRGAVILIDSIGGGVDGAVGNGGRIVGVDSTLGTKVATVDVSRTFVVDSISVAVAADDGARFVRVGTRVYQVERRLVLDGNRPSITVAFQFMVVKVQRHLRHRAPVADYDACIETDIVNHFKRRDELSSASLQRGLVARIGGGDGLREVVMGRGRATVGSDRRRGVVGNNLAGSVHAEAFVEILPFKHIILVNHFVIVAFNIFGVVGGDGVGVGSGIDGTTVVI